MNMNVTINQAAKATGLSTAIINRWILWGDVAAKRINGQLLVNLSDLDDRHKFTPWRDPNDVTYDQRYAFYKKVAEELFKTNTAATEKDYVVALKKAKKKFETEPPLARKAFLSIREVYRNL